MPAAGSSRRSRLGFVANARAISRRRCLPYGSDVASTSASSFRPTISISSMASSRFAISSLRFSPKVAEKTFASDRIWVAIRTFSKTVMALNRRMFWKVLAIPSFVIQSGVLTIEFE